MLPSGIRLCVAESYRPLALQQRYWQRANAKLRPRGEHPSWSDDDVADEAAKYVAPPWITPPHSTGGAIDLVLIDDDGRELDMGCPLNEHCAAMMTRADGLSSDASANRQVLVEAMTSAGFVNYDHEWWHYSFGDRYWAYATKTPSALYDGI
jgi:D-alanyl-D-alanine dipeptidase